MEIELEANKKISHSSLQGLVKVNWNDWNNLSKTVPNLFNGIILDVWSGLKIMTY